MAETPNIDPTDGSGQSWRWVSIIRKNLRIILGFPSAIVGMSFLAISSFSEKQFVGNYQSLHCLVFVVFTALFVAFIFSGRSINSCLETVCHWHFSMKAVIHCVSFVIVSVLAFLIKYPRFNIHSALLTSSNCIHEVERNEISHGNQFNLFSVGAFALLAFLISSERHKPTELGFSSLLLGLTIDASMEIPGRDGPNLWYVFGAALYCVFLIFLRHYVNTQLESTNKNTFLLVNMLSERLRGMFLKLLELISAALGIVFLFVCPFSKYQFGDDTAVMEVAIIVVFALLLGYFMSSGPGFISYIANQCHSKRLIKAMVSSLLLMIFSVFIFLTKYPRFQIYSKHKESCANQKKRKELPHGSQFDLYSAAAFSLVALTISSEKEQAVELGIFHFLLELTMDASIETLENKALNLCYMGGAAVYCVVLIFAGIYLAPPETRCNSDVGVQKDGGRSCSSNVSGTEGQQQPETRIQIDDDGLEDVKAGLLQEYHKPENNSEEVEIEVKPQEVLLEDKTDEMLLEEKPESKSKGVLLENTPEEVILEDKPEEQRLRRRIPRWDNSNTVVFKTRLYSDGYIKKIFNTLRKIKGVEDVSVDKSTEKLTVTGKVHPLRVRDTLAKKLGRNVELLFPQPNNDENDNAGMLDDKPEEERLLQRIPRLESEPVAKLVKIVREFNGIEQVEANMASQRNIATQMQKVKEIQTLKVIETLVLKVVEKLKTRQNSRSGWSIRPRQKST